MDEPPVQQLIAQVLDAMLPTEINVFAPDETIVNTYDGDGKLVYEGSRTVVAKEWLPLACQSIAWGQTEGDALATYSHNLIRVLLGGVYGKQSPLGPAAMIGEITIAHRMDFHDQRTGEAFALMLAHELVHAVRYLPVIVPAFTAWRTFRRSFDAGINAEDIVCGWLETRQRFLDQYGSEIEKREIAHFWPTDMVEQWWEALRG